MDTMSNYMRGVANRGRALRVFDWNKAAELLRNFDSGTAKAGLADDWGWTAGRIWEDGTAVIGEYTYLASNWATPILLLPDDTEVECWVWHGDTGWDADTQWPDSARALLGGDNGGVTTQNEQSPDR